MADWRVHVCLGGGSSFHTAWATLISRNGPPALSDLVIFQEKVEMWIFTLKSSH